MASTSSSPLLAVTDRGPVLLDHAHPPRIANKPTSTMLADIRARTGHVRFTPESGHAQSWHQRLQSARPR